MLIGKKTSALKKDPIDKSLRSKTPERWWTMEPEKHHAMILEVTETQALTNLSQAQAIYLVQGEAA